MTTSALAVDASSGKDVNLSHTLTGPTAIANPSGGSKGQRIVFKLTQDGAGSHQVTWGSAYSFSARLSTPILNGTPGGTDLLGFMYDISTAKWVYVARGDHFGDLLPSQPWRARVPQVTWSLPQSVRVPAALIANNKRR